MNCSLVLLNPCRKYVKSQGAKSPFHKIKSLLKFYLEIYLYMKKIRSYSPFAFRIKSSDHIHQIHMCIVMYRIIADYVILYTQIH